jgi:hypothetical protein
VNSLAKRRRGMPLRVVMAWLHQRSRDGSWRRRIVSGAVLASTAGCAQILGLHERTESTEGASGSDAGKAPDSAALGEGQCGELVHASVSCASCMDQSCCAEARACAGDPACQEASECLASCTDAGCRARCGVFYALPETLIALRSCRVQKCETACGSSCGEYASGIPACQACREASCCSQGATCAKNTTCAALDLCRSNCFLATSCPTDCESKYPQGATDFSAWFSCTDQCASACQTGQSWQCLDSPIIWPKPKGVGSLTFSITFVDFILERPFVGASVKACDKLDFPCATPLANGLTDGSGLVALTVPAGLAGFDGYLDVSGGKVDGTGSSTFPALWYPIPFVVSDGWRGRSQIPSADEFPLLASAAGATLDPARGHFAANAVDCAFGASAHVSFVADSADTNTQGYYLVSGVPVATANETDQSGIGGFINLPTGPTARLAVIQAFSGAAGAKKSMGSFTFIIRPATVTTTSTYPPVP